MSEQGTPADFAAMAAGLRREREPEQTEPSNDQEPEPEPNTLIADAFAAKEESNRRLIETVHGPFEEVGGAPNFDGGVRETAEPTDVNPEQSHNEAVVALAEQARQREFGA